MRQFFASLMHRIFGEAAPSDICSCGVTRDGDSGEQFHNAGGQFVCAYCRDVGYGYRRAGTRLAGVER